jgi:hypothetical protein
MAMLHSNTISRIALIYHPENLDAAAETFQSALGITDFEILTPEGFGMRVIVSLSAGIELITPHGEGRFSAMAHDCLERQGEGLFGIVYRVPDLEAAEKKAAEANFPRLGDRINGFDVNPAWREEFSFMSESFLGPIAGVVFALIQADKL